MLQNKRFNISSILLDSITSAHHSSDTISTITIDTVYKKTKWGTGLEPPAGATYRCTVKVESSCSQQF